jgi:hypothetical protein
MSVNAPFKSCNFMVLNKTIGITMVMVPLRDTSGAGTILGNYQLGFGHMGSVATY